MGRRGKDSSSGIFGRYRADGPSESEWANCRGGRRETNKRFGQQVSAEADPTVSAQLSGLLASNSKCADPTRPAPRIAGGLWRRKDTDG